MWQDSSAGRVFGFDGAKMKTDQFADALWIAQTFTQLQFVVCCLAWTFGCCQRRASVLKQPRQFIGWWLIGLVLVIIIHVIFFFVALSDHLIERAFSRGWPVLIAIFLFPISILIVDEYLRRKFQEKYAENQLFLRLDFDTRLGMYSPKSPWDNNYH